MKTAKRWILLILLGNMVMTLFLSAILVPTPEAKPPQKVVYLTFDDGPSQRYTPKILDILHRNGVHATFFVLGFRAQQYPRIVRRMRADGHEIGNHSYYHQILLGKSDAWVRNDLVKANNIIRRISGVNPILYRPPGGLINGHEKRLIRNTGHPVVLWNVDSRDWKTASTRRIVANVMKNVKPGAIVLMHDGVSNSRYTVQALPIIIRECRQRGFVFKVLPSHD